MAQYHALISGLPNISLDMSKSPYSQEEFYSELLEILSSKDREKLDWLRLEQVNKEFIALFRAGAFAPNLDSDEEEEDQEVAHITLPVKELKQIARAAQLGQPIRRNEVVPGYMIRFLNEQYYQAPEDSNLDEEPVEECPLSDEDRLAQLYYGAASHSKNAFLAEWFRFNQTLRNVLLVHTCRQLGWSAERYIIGDTAVEEQLLHNKSKDFGLSDDIPYITTFINIAEERDIAKRERMIDALRWQWLEENTEWTVFDLENVLAYYLKLGIIERWFRLDEEKGKAVFREIVLGLKKESNRSLQEFKTKTKKN